MERYVYVLNADKYSNENIDLAFDDKDDAFPATAFSSASVNPIIKSTNIAAEHNGVSANFFEIRSGPYDGMISSDESSKIVNRIYPSANATDITAYAKNRQQTRSYKLRTYVSGSNETHNQKVIGSGGLGIDLDTNDYFVLINPEIAHSTSDKHPSIRPHFAKITQIISYDTYGDGFEFEPKYNGPIPKDTNFEIYKGPLTTATDIVAVSYGLRGDGNEINPANTDDTNFEFITDKYDASNQVSRPTWYFYNDRLQYKDQLDYDTKYTLTTCRWWANWTDVGDYANAAADTQFAFNALLTTPSNQPTLIIGQSVYYKDNSNNYIYMGNVATDTSNNFTVDYARNALPLTSSQTDLSVYVGRTVHQTVFRTEREFGDLIQDLGPKNQHATFVDNMYDNDTIKTDYETESTYTFNPSIWKDSFRNYKRTTNDLKSSASGYTTAGEISTLTANLTGPKRYMYYKSSHLRNNAVVPVTELRVNNPKNKISQIAKIKTLDGSGIQFLKLKEDENLVVTKSLHTSTLNEFKLPYYADSNYVFALGSHVFSIVLQKLPDKEVDYGASTTIKANDIIRIKDTYYKVSTVNAEANNKQYINVDYKKKASDSTWSQMTAETHFEPFVQEDVFIMAWNGGLNSSCPIDSEGVYSSNTLQRLTMHGNTVSLTNNSLYNRKVNLLNPEFYGHDIDINYGDSLHNHIKLKTTKKFYQPDDERIDFMYYYNGNYTIEEEAFNGTIEDIESSSDGGLLTYTITGRDKTSILLSNVTSNNLNKSDDVVLSSLAPVFDTPSTRFTVTATTTPLQIAGNVSSQFTNSKYDLIFNKDGELLGEIDSVIYESIPQTTNITLKGYTGNTITTGTNDIMWVKLSHNNYLTGMKAMATNLDATKYPTDYSSIGEKGIVFHDGEKITYSGAFAYSDLLNTSSIGTFSTDRTVGYDISDVKGIEESYDSSFAFKLSNEKVADISYNPTQTVAMNHYHIVESKEQIDGPSTYKIAPSFPIVLGSIDTNTSDNTAWGTDMRYLYMVNSNIPSGGFIHTLKDTHSNYYLPKNTFRYWGIQRFKEGSIAETHDSIYNTNKGTQRITAAMPMYKINALGEKQTPVDGDLTPGLKPLRDSNFWTGSLIGMTDRAAPIEWAKGTSQVSSPISWTELENIDYRAKNYQLLSIGDIYPDSKLRWNNIQAQTKDFSTYGMMIESEGSEGKSISHQNFTGTTNNTNTSDSNYERLEITSSPTTTNNTKRFGIIRLIEATFDWHFNPVDYESVPRTEDLDSLSHFKYPRMKKIYDSIEITNSSTSNPQAGSNELTLNSNVTLQIGDLIYRGSDGKILAIIQNSAVTNSNTLTHYNGVSGNYSAITSAVGDNDWIGKISIFRQKLFNMYADDNWGINDQLEVGIKMPNMYLAIPGLDRSYIEHSLLTDGSDTMDGHNLWIPLLSELYDSGSGAYEDWVSAFHESYEWTGTSLEQYFHPSRIINAINERTYSNQEDADQYNMDTSAHLYDNCHVLFKEFKRATEQNTNNTLISQQTSSYIKPWPTLWGTFNPSVETDQHSRYVKVNTSASGTDKEKTGICGTKTNQHLLAEDEIRGYVDGNGDKINWGTRVTRHNAVTGEKKGDIFNAQTFFKPKLNLSSHNSSTIDIELDASCVNAWIDFVPDLTGYYLVSDLTTTTNTYLPSKEHMETTDKFVLNGEPKLITKIISHTTDTASIGTGHGDHVTHTIKLDSILNTTDHGKTFRLMKISETTFEDTPDYFEVNKMFNTGLKYNTPTQNFITGKETDVADGDSGVNIINNHDLIYQEGLFSMYLLLDVDHGTNANTHIERRTLADADDLFSDGDSLNCWITDGTHSVEKNILISRVTDSKLRFSYDGKLTGYGVVSFGETFTIESSSSPQLRNPKTAYIGTTFSIGTDVEKAIEEMLEENDIEVDTSERNLIYTGNIVNTNTTASNIDIDGTLQNITEGDIIYNQDGKLIGKTVAPAGGADITIEDIFYKPIKNDEITKYERKPHILNTNFTDQDIFSAINYLAAKKSLDYNFDGNKIKIRDLDNYNTHRKFALKYRDGTNLISVDSNTSLFDKASKIIVIGDNVKAEIEVPSKTNRTIKHIDSNIKNSQEAKIKGFALLELHNKPSRKITLTLEKTGFELMKAGDLISLDFPNHNIPADDYIVFEIENIMSSVAKITVGTFNKTVAERLSEIAISQSKGFTNLLTKNTTKVLTARLVLDDMLMMEKSLNYELKSTEGGSTFGFV